VKNFFLENFQMDCGIELVSLLFPPHAEKIFDLPSQTLVQMKCGHMFANSLMKDLRQSFILWVESCFRIYSPITTFVNIEKSQEFQRPTSRTWSWILS
jgi:hypothetical protein